MNTLRLANLPFMDKLVATGHDWQMSLLKQLLFLLMAINLSSCALLSPSGPCASESELICHQDADCKMISTVCGGKSAFNVRSSDRLRACFQQKQNRIKCDVDTSDYSQAVPKCIQNKCELVGVQ